MDAARARTRVRKLAAALGTAPAERTEDLIELSDDHPKWELLSQFTLKSFHALRTDVTSPHGRCTCHTTPVLLDRDELFHPLAPAIINDVSDVPHLRFLEAGC